MLAGWLAGWLVAYTSGKGHAQLHSRDSAHDSGVKFSPCVAAVADFTDSSHKYCCLSWLVVQLHKPSTICCSFRLTSDPVLALEDSLSLPQAQEFRPMSTITPSWGGSGHKTTPPLGKVIWPVARSQTLLNNRKEGLVNRPGWKGTLGILLIAETSVTSRAFCEKCSTWCSKLSTNYEQKHSRL